MPLDITADQPCAPPSLVNALRIVKVDSESQFLTLKGEWNRLASSCGIDSVFLKHEWFDAAWQWLKSDAELRLLCVYQEDRLIGISPLVLRTDNRGAFPVRRIEFLTVPDTQLCDLLAAPTDIPLVTGAVAKALFDMRHEWDTLSLSYLPESARAFASLPTELARRGMRPAKEPAGINLFVALAGSWEAFYGTRGRRLKKSNNLVANRLKKAGEVAIAQQISPDDLEGFLQIITAISSRSWKKETGLSLENPGPANFIRRLSEHARNNGWLSVWLLSLDGKPVAMEYQLAYQGNIHALRSDFDAAFGELSPGSHLNWILLQQLFEKGLDRYYMGPGNNAYKLRWTEAGAPLCRLTAYSANWRGLLIYWMNQKIRPAARRIRALMNKSGEKPQPAQDEAE